MSDIKDKVKQVVAEQLSVDPKKIQPESSFIEDLGADSLDIVELVMALEEAFSIEIPDEEAEQITTIQGVHDYIENYLEKNPPKS